MTLKRTKVNCLLKKSHRSTDSLARSSTIAHMYVSCQSKSYQLLYSHTVNSCTKNRTFR